MYDMICNIRYYIDDIEFNKEVIVPVEDEIHIQPNKYDKEQDLEFEREMLLESLLLQLIREDIGSDVELIDFKPLVDETFDIYKLTY